MALWRTPLSRLVIGEMIPRSTRSLNNYAKGMDHALCIVLSARCPKLEKCGIPLQALCGSGCERSRQMSALESGRKSIFACPWTADGNLHVDSWCCRSNRSHVADLELCMLMKRLCLRCGIPLFTSSSWVHVPDNFDLFLITFLE